MSWIDALFGLFRRRRPAPPPPGPGPAPPAIGLDAANAARAAAGRRPPLLPHPALEGTAQDWADRMARSGVLSHGDFKARIAGVLPGAACAEDIALGQPDAASVVAAWLSDPPHRANLLGPYTHAGLGSARDAQGRMYWCLDLARPVA